MGFKGIHISLFLLSGSSLLLIISLLLDWQHISVFGAITAKLHLVTVEWDGAVRKFFPLMTKVPESAFSGNLSSVRDVFCGFRAIPTAASLCETFTFNFVCGVIVVLLSIACLTINLVAGTYLLYYSWGVTKREYRKVAFRCLCVSPALMFIGICIYTGSLVMSANLRIRFVSPVLTPGKGYFVSIFAFLLGAFVPFISKKWALSTKEILDDEKRQYRREAKEQLFDSYGYNGSGYGTMTPYSHDTSYAKDPLNYEQAHAYTTAYPSLVEPQYSGEIYADLHYAPEHPTSPMRQDHQGHPQFMVQGPQPVEYGQNMNHPPMDYPGEYVAQASGYAHPPQGQYY